MNLDSMTPEIVLVEDNPTDAAIFRRILTKQYSCSIKVIEDGEAAVNFFLPKCNKTRRAIASNLKCIFLDLKLPKLNGHEVLKQIKKDDYFKKTPIIILSSSKEEMDISLAYDTGANSYIHKPMTYEDFQHAITNATHYWLNLNEINGF
ncbi:MAG: response regulator [Sphingobacteriia bacterium]|nr:response regulator [Sphingobacteriia bacterium]